MRLAMVLRVVGIRNQRSRCDSVVHPEEPVIHVASAWKGAADLVLAVMHAHDCPGGPDGLKRSVQEVLVSCKEARRGNMAATSSKA